MENNLSDYITGFFGSDYFKDYVIITVSFFLSFLILPAFVLAGYMINVMSHAGSKNYMDKVSSVGLIQQFKDGFMFSVYAIIANLVVGFVLFLVIGVLGSILSVIGIDIFTLMASPLLILFMLVVMLLVLILFNALLVSYAKERKIVKSLTSMSNVKNCLMDGEFYIYSILLFFVIIVGSITFIGAGLGYVMGYGLLGLVIKRKSGDKLKVGDTFKLYKNGKAYKKIKILDMKKGYVKVNISGKDSSMKKEKLEAKLEQVRNNKNMKVEKA